MEASVLQLSVFTEEVEENAARVAGPELAASLPSDLDGLTDDELLTAAAHARRVTSWAQARELAAIAALHRRRIQAEQNGDPDYRILDAHESTCQEVSVTLAITPRGAGDLVDLANRLDAALPGTRHALESGHIDRSKALVLDELTHGLEPELVERIEGTVLPTADQRTTGQLRRRIRTLIKRLAPEQQRERKREAVQERRLEVWDDDYSGTSGLSVSGLDPVTAHGTFNRITAAAQGIRADGDPRSLHQLRADLAQRLLHGHPLPEAIRLAEIPPSDDFGLEGRPETLAVTPTAVRPITGPGGVPSTGTAATSDMRAASRTDRHGGTPAKAIAVLVSGSVDRALVEPAAHSAASAVDVASDGIAAVIADMADRELTALRDHLKASGRAHALPFRIARAAHDIHDRLGGLRESWCRTHDPAHGRNAYRPTITLRRAIEARHITCAFPTCNRRSSRCDLDHTVPWGPGKSCLCNLAPLCRGHHRTKQTPGWRLVQPWPGLLIWVTPSGNWHITLPARE